MKRFFAKIGRFFWSWGFLKFVLAVIALVILLYIEEDWRGAHNWAVTKARWEAKGETFDYSKFIPPPVPDNQNLAAIPLFKLGPSKYTNSNSYVGMPALDQAIHEDLSNLEYVPTGNWMEGELPDKAKIQKAIAANYSLVFKDAKPPDDALTQFNAIYPFFSDFLAAAATHPVFRINMDYAVSPPAARSFGPIVATLQLSKILELHGILALDQRHSDLALQDIKASYVLVCGAKRDLTLVGGLVALGETAIGNGILYDGLAQHEWNDAQLAELDQTLKPINFLADFQFAMRCEVAQSTVNVEFFEHASRAQMHKIFGDAMAESGLAIAFRNPWPSGWWDGNKSRMATRLFLSLANVDPQSHLVFPKGADDLQLQIEKAKAGWVTYAPWNILADMVSGPITKALQKYAEAQVWVDEARIACALERYRLAHGVYPGSLDALAPACIDELPHDIMNGQPYHYQLRSDGTYLLYSVGWNQTDDGGKVVYKKDAPRIIDYNEGDWVWPTPK